MVFLDRTLMLLAWCCLRQDFRRFRLDLMSDVTLTSDYFRPRRVLLLREFLRQIRDGGPIATPTIPPPRSLDPVASGSPAPPPKNREPEDRLSVLPMAGRLVRLPGSVSAGIVGGTAIRGDRLQLLTIIPMTNSTE